MRLKPRCVVLNCKNKLPMTTNHFRMYGNYCLPCMTELSRDMVLRKGGKRADALRKFLEKLAKRSI